MNTRFPKKAILAFLIVVLITMACGQPKASTQTEPTINIDEIQLPEGFALSHVPVYQVCL